MSLIKNKPRFKKGDKVLLMGEYEREVSRVFARDRWLFTSYKYEFKGYSGTLWSAICLSPYNLKECE